MKHDDSLWCSDVLTHSDVIRQRCLLTALGHVHHGNVGIVELIQNIGLTKVQPLEADLMKIHP